MATIPGTGGNDSLSGGDEPDLIDADAGNDTIDGGAGSDTVSGGDGADFLIWAANPDATGDHDIYHGGSGGEEYEPDVYSHNGGDTLSLVSAGAEGFDVYFTSGSSGEVEDAYGNTLSFDGIERVATGDGADHINASGSAEGIRIYAGAGNDYIIGSDATDYIQGGDGNDEIFGGGGNDVIEDGRGDDTIHGEDGDDGIRWGNGGIDGSVGNDLYYGGSGYNTLNAWQHDATGNGVHMVLTTSDSGTVDATGAATGHLEFYEFRNLLTGNGNDTIDGSAAGVDGFRAYAAWGDDSIIGSDGDDSIEGGFGTDTIDAGAGDDMISMAGDLFSTSHAWEDDGSDLLVLRDGFGNDTVRAFAIETTQDEWGTVLPADRLDVSDLHDANGNPIDLDDVTVEPLTDARGTHARLVFPNGETLLLYEIDPAALTRQKLHQLGIPCFCRGTMIRTDRGEIAVEQLSVGDLVLTCDHGLQPIRWIGSRALDAIDLAAAPRLRPVCIRRGALGEGRPCADLMVSPQHRILVRSAIAQRMFGCPEVLVAAKQLLAIEGIEEVDPEMVGYFHILFDRHEIVLANGAEAESLYTGPMALKSVGRAAREEIFTLFPELRDTPAEAARPLIPGAKARQLAHRHVRNRKALNG
uniref:Hint domain-containing protein n=1 Tax=Paracoccus sp. TRP TaxID=412597 RepID=UPI000225F2BA|nr:Hint domain-containing protein [Paracoccus sp. TRP]